MRYSRRHSLSGRHVRRGQEARTGKRVREERGLRLPVVQLAMEQGKRTNIPVCFLPVSKYISLPVSSTIFILLISNIVTLTLQCSAKCGSGVQTRKVFCGTFSDDTVKKVADENCEPDEKFEDTKNCTAKEPCKGEWFAGPWSKVCFYSQKRGTSEMSHFSSLL